MRPSFLRLFFMRLSLLLLSRYDTANEYIYVYFCMNQQMTIQQVVEGDPKAPFSKATTPMSRGGRNYFPGIAPLYP